MFRPRNKAKRAPGGAFFVCSHYIAAWGFSLMFRSVGCSIGWAELFVGAMGQFGELYSGPENSRTAITSTDVKTPMIRWKLLTTPLSTNWSRWPLLCCSLCCSSNRRISLLIIPLSNSPYPVCKVWAQHSAFLPKPYCQPSIPPPWAWQRHSPL